MITDTTNIPTVTNASHVSTGEMMRRITSMFIPYINMLCHLSGVDFTNIENEFEELIEFINLLVAKPSLDRTQLIFNGMILSGILTFSQDHPMHIEDTSATSIVVLKTFKQVSLVVGIALKTACPLLLDLVFDRYKYIYGRYKVTKTWQEDVFNHLEPLIRNDELDMYILTYLLDKTQRPTELCEKIVELCEECNRSDIIDTINAEKL